jgi:hypothetical protein
MRQKLARIKCVFSVDLGRDSLNPPYKSGGGAKAQLVEAFVEGERLFSIESIWNDRLGATLVQLLAQFALAIGGIAQHALRWLQSSDKALCARAIDRLAFRQQDGDQTASSICEWRNPRVAPSARETNSPLWLARPFC